MLKLLKELKGRERIFIVLAIILIVLQVILDLKGKLAPSGKDIVNTNSELVEVLTSLGYKNPDIKKVIPNVNMNLSIEEQVKEALKLLLK